MELDSLRSARFRIKHINDQPGRKVSITSSHARYIITWSIGSYNTSTELFFF